MRLFAALALAFLLSGCATVPLDVEAPKLELQSISVVDPSLTAATFVFGLRVANPNGFDLDLDSLDYELKLNGTTLSLGETSKAVTLPKNDKTIVDLPFRVPYDAIFRTFEELLTKRSVDYQLSGIAMVHNRRIPFELKGKTDVPGGMRGPAD